MATPRIVSACGAAVLIVAAGFMIVRAEDPPSSTASDAAADQLPVSDPSCTYFGPNRDKFIGSQNLDKATLTANVAAQLAPAAEVMSAFAANAM